MFTGIIEDLGIIKSLQTTQKSAKVHIQSPLIVSDLKTGDSIAVNGICLTATSFDTASFSVDVMMETLQKTNLGKLKPGQKVNLERALRLSDRLGGHLVSGHIDATGTIQEKTIQEIAIVLKITYPPKMDKYLIPKGSVAIDGTSLTIVEVKPPCFTVSLIPHTRGLTTLGFKDVGDTVNLEFDIIAKYLEKLKNSSQTLNDASPEIGLAFLAENGFA